MSGRQIFLILSFLLILLLARSSLFFFSTKDYKEGQIVNFATTLNSEPKQGINYQQISFVLPNHQRGFTKLNPEPMLSYGDKVEISGIIHYLDAKDGKKLVSITYPKVNIQERKGNFFVDLRKRLINFFSQNLDTNSSSLMLGIVFGIKQNFSTSFAINIKNVGLLHVIAASGMNIAMIGGFLTSIFSYFLKRQVALALSLAGIMFYALLAGLEPSIVRAAIMGGLVFSSQIMGRQSTSFVGLFIAGFLMLFTDPSLILDAGFQLSFMATLGLITLRPVFLKSSKIKNLVEKSVIGEDILTTTVAQIFTLPILLLSFQAYSPLSILSNALVLWTVPILMIIGGLAALIGLFIEPVGRLLLFFSQPLLDFFKTVVNIFGEKASVFTITNIPYEVIIGYYLLIASVILALKSPKIQKI